MHPTHRAPPLALLCLTLLAATAHAQRAVPAVLTGIDVVAAEGAGILGGRKIGLVTNHTGRTWDGRRTIDVLRATKDVELVALFSPEHGLQGALDREGIAHGTDEATGLKVWSLYGETRKPTKPMLEGIDTLVFDIQDIGCRFYTYVSTMGLALEAAAEHGLQFVVLDRPNPIDGVHMAGPVLDPGKESFVGHHTIPLRHGMTAGELMRMLVGEKGIAVDAKLVPCRGWTRNMTFDRTGLPWVNPSPNMRNLTQALLYPGIGVIEGTNVSVGRGTDTPFEVVGAPWIDGIALAARLRAEELPGVTFVPVRFTPSSSKHEKKECGGVQIAVTDWQTFEPVLTGIALACALRDLFGADWKHDKLDWLLRDQAALDAFLAGKDARTIERGWKQELEVFRMRRKPFLVYE